MGKALRVQCVESGEVFDSAAAAAKEIGVGHSAICKALKSGGRSGGFHWRRFTGDYETGDPSRTEAALDEADLSLASLGPATVVCGITGSGKTFRVCRRLILEGGADAIVVIAKKDLVGMTLDGLLAQGYYVARTSLEAYDPVSSIALSGVGRDDGLGELARATADAIVDSVPGEASIACIESECLSFAIEALLDGGGGERAGVRSLATLISDPSDLRMRSRGYAKLEARLPKDELARARVRLIAKLVSMYPGTHLDDPWGGSVSARSLVSTIRSGSPSRAEGGSVVFVEVTPWATATCVAAAVAQAAWSIDGAVRGTGGAADKSALFVLDDVMPGCVTDRVASVIADGVIPGLKTVLTAMSENSGVIAGPLRSALGVQPAHDLEFYQTVHRPVRLYTSDPGSSGRALRYRVEHGGDGSGRPRRPSAVRGTPCSTVASGNTMNSTDHCC